MSTNPEIIIINAKILTMDNSMHRAEALAISGNRISSLGTTTDMIALGGSSTQIIDAAGATVLPGFVESHMHLFSGAAGSRLLQLFGIRGMDSLSGAIRSYASAHPDEGLLIGKGTSYTVLEDVGPLTRHHLDDILPDRPILLIAPDHHTGWANTIALERAGILGGRNVGVGNEIVMGSDGTATGELREGKAMRPVMNLRTSGGRDRLGLEGVEPDPAPTGAQKAADIEILRWGLDYCASCGITSIHNMDGNFYQLELLQRIESDGGMAARVQIPFHLTADKSLDSLEEASEMDRQYRSPMLRSGRVKIFSDGVIDSGTAVLVEDYADRPGWRGEPLFTAEDFKAAAIEIDRRGLQISVHAIGDGAVRMVLDGYEAARKANGVRDSRHRIEHIELVHPDDIPRFAELGVIASMQPPHPPGSMGLPLQPTLGKIGRDRWKWAYAWRTLWNNGVRIAFASDWPVSPLEPMRGIHAAVTRKKWADDLPDQSATLLEAVASYTREGAYTGFAERSTGTLEVGKLADIVILSDDIEAANVDELEKIVPVTTICDGRITFKAG